MTLPYVRANYQQRHPDFDWAVSPAAIDWFYSIEDSQVIAPLSGDHCYILTIGKDLLTITSQEGMEAIASGTFGGSKWWLFCKIADGTETSTWRFDFTTSGSLAFGLIGIAVTGSAFVVVGAVHTNIGNDCYADAVDVPAGVGDVMAGYLWAGHVAGYGENQLTPDAGSVTRSRLIPADPSDPAIPSVRPWSISVAYLDSPPDPSPQVNAPTTGTGDDNIGLQILFCEKAAAIETVLWWDPAHFGV